ncbi:MAG: acyl-CoA dehydrogenase family protein [Candidatus Tectomicrobia bacterium]|nr:acyl-CoA dehydrogenase family protein [Candidatus Tectomicrobia bacterium]
MVDFSLTDEQKLIQNMTRRIAGRELGPGATSRDERSEFPKELIRRLGQNDLMGIIVPQEEGGLGLDFISFLLALEEISRIDASAALLVAIHTILCTNHLIRYGTKNQKEHYLSQLSRGALVGCWALTEPYIANDASRLMTRAIPRDDGWVISGIKMFIPLASLADLIVVFAATDPSLKEGGVSAFLIERNSQGLRYGRREATVGLRAVDISELIFEGVKVTKEQLLGTLNHGFIEAQEILNSGKVAYAAIAVGLARGAMEWSIRYTKERKREGQYLSESQGVRWMIAEMAIEIESARLLAFKAASLIEKGEEATREASMAKVFAADVAMRTTIKAMQILGDQGYVRGRGYPTERQFRDASMIGIIGDVTEIHKSMIAQTLMGSGDQRFPLMGRRLRRSNQGT